MIIANLILLCCHLFLFILKYIDFNQLFYYGPLINFLNLLIDFYLLLKKSIIDLNFNFDNSIK